MFRHQLFVDTSHYETHYLPFYSKGRTIRKFMGGGGAGEVQKKNSRKGKFN